MGVHPHPCFALLAAFFATSCFDNDEPNIPEQLARHIQQTRENPQRAAQLMLVGNHVATLHDRASSFEWHNKRHPKDLDELLR